MKELIQRLEVYKAKISAQIEAGVTAKHKDHAATYLAFLKKELESVSRKIASLKM